MATDQHDPMADAARVLPVLQGRAETRSYYNKISRVYDLLAEHSEWPLRELALDLLAPKPGETAIEIGCGTGRALVRLGTSVGRDGRVVGFDLAESMAQRTLGDRVVVASADALRLPISASSVDVAFVGFTLELFAMSEMARCLSEMARVLRPGGRLAVVGLSRRPKDQFAVKAYEWTHRHFPNLFDCRPIYVEETLRGAGFQILEARLEHMWVPVEVVLAKVASGLSIGDRRSAAAT